MPRVPCVRATGSQHATSCCHPIQSHMQQPKASKAGKSSSAPRKSGDARAVDKVRGVGLGPGLPSPELARSKRPASDHVPRPPATGMAGPPPPPSMLWGCEGMAACVSCRQAVAPTHAWPWLVIAAGPRTPDPPRSWSPSFGRWKRRRRGGRRSPRGELLDVSRTPSSEHGWPKPARPKAAPALRRSPRQRRKLSSKARHGKRGGGGQTVPWELRRAICV